MPELTVGSDRNNPVDIHYEDHGTGAPVVLIHGWPLSGRSWEHQVPALVDAGYRVIIYDRRGFGASSQPWGGYDHDTFAADLRALLEHLDVSGATLVGFSMGGGEVARYLGTYGAGRVSKAVLAAAVPPYLYRSDDNPDGGLDDDTIGAFEAGVTGDRIAFLEEFTKGFFNVGDGEARISEPNRLYHRAIAEFASPKGTLDCIAAFGRTDFRGDLEAMSDAEIPTLVIHGDADAIVPFEVSGKRAHESIDDAELVLVQGAPHGLNATHAREFNAALLAFLAK